MPLAEPRAVPAWTLKERADSRWACGLLIAIMFGLSVWGLPGLFDQPWAGALYAFCKGLILTASVYITIFRPRSNAVLYVLLTGVPFLTWNLIALLYDGVTVIGVTSILSELSIWFAMAIGILLLPTYETLRRLLRASLFAISLYFTVSLLCRAAGVQPTAEHDAIPLFYITPDRWGMDTLCLLAVGIIFILYPNRLRPRHVITVLCLIGAVVLSMIRIYYLAGLIVAVGTFLCTRGRKGLHQLLPILLLCLPMIVPVFNFKSGGSAEVRNEDDAIWGIQTDGRLRTWEFLIGAASRHPWLGNGPGFDSIMIGNATDDYAGTEPDNDFIALASGAGWPAALLLFVGIWIPVGYVLGTTRRIAPILRWTSLSYALAYTVISLTDNPLRNPGSCYPLFICTGMALRQASEHGRPITALSNTSACV